VESDVLLHRLITTTTFPGTKRRRERENGRETRMQTINGWRAHNQRGTVQSHSAAAGTVSAEAVESAPFVGSNTLHQTGEDVGNCTVPVPGAGVSQLLAELGGRLEVQQRQNWGQNLQSMDVEVPQQLSCALWDRIEEGARVDRLLGILSTSATNVRARSKNSTLWGRFRKILLEWYLGIPRPLLYLDIRLQRMR
jgi:hypothetical protein